MNDGIKILLERMQTHPEEFAVGEGVIGKWDSLVREYETILDLEDIALFKQARGKLLQQQFTERVLEELVDPKKSKWETVGMVTSNMPSVIPTPNPSIPNLTFEIPKEHKTLFGRLFNYS